MNTHLLQSPDWEHCQNSEGYQTFTLSGPDFSALAIFHPTPLGNYLFLPYGPTLASKKALSPALEAIKALAKSKNAIFIRIEPTQAFTGPEIAKIAQKTGLYTQKSHDLNPAHTWQLDLSPDTAEILDQIETTKVRHWRNHQQKNLQIRTSKALKDLKILTSLLKQIGEADNFTPQDQKHLAHQLKTGFATLYILELDQKTPLAAALAYDHHQIRYYAHAATDLKYRRLSGGTILLIQMILDAKQAGAKIFDFWGITTSTNPKHPWYGFTQYKKSFGGFQVDYSGTYDLILNRRRYRTYQLFRYLNRFKRKIQKSSQK